MNTMDIRNINDFIHEVAQLVESYRTQCFWFMAPRFLPDDLQSALRALSYLEKYGDRKAFIRTSELRKWLSQNSSVTSAG